MVYHIRLFQNGAFMIDHHAGNFFVADAHCDFLYSMVNADMRLDTLQARQCSYLPYMQEGRCALQFFAVWIDTGLEKPYFQQFLEMANAYWQMIDRYGELVPFSRSFVPESGKIAAVLTVEGGEALEGKPENIEALYRMGVRALTLTWNESNELAGAAMGYFNRGLTRLGKCVVKELNRVGIAIDVAHLSDAGIDDLLELSSSPIFASHSNSRVIMNHRRNLSLRHIQEISRRGGVIGVNYFYKQLCRGRHASIADIVRHIDNIAAIGGIDCVALGSDFDGMDRYPTDLVNASEVPKLLDELLCLGYSEDAVRKIAYDNLRNFIVQFYPEEPRYRPR